MYDTDIEIDLLQLLNDIERLHQMISLVLINELLNQPDDLDLFIEIDITTSQFPKEMQ